MEADRQRQCATSSGKELSSLERKLSQAADQLAAGSLQHTASGEPPAGAQADSLEESATDSEGSNAHARAAGSSTFDESGTAESDTEGSGADEHQTTSDDDDRGGALDAQGNGASSPAAGSNMGTGGGLDLALQGLKLDNVDALQPYQLTLQVSA